jgi:DNA-binding response OmpR family regulator
MMNVRESRVGLSSSFSAPPPIVLVVDDSADTLNKLCEGISAAGYAVLVAADCDDALRYMSFVMPDAFLIDAVSADVKGFELGRRIKSTPAWADIPVFFMVEMANSTQIIGGFENGGTDYLSKPLRISEVLARLTTRVIAYMEAKEAEEG